MESEEYYEFEEALELLKNNQVLVINFINRYTYVVLDKDTYIIKNENLSLSYTFEMFKDQFKDYKFYIYKEEETIDPKKDEEYYRWHQ